MSGRGGEGGGGRGERGPDPGLAANYHLIKRLELLKLSDFNYVGHILAAK